MVPAARWLVVTVVAAGLAATPTVLAAIPPTASHVTATALAAEIRSARTLGWSGEIKTQGSLSVPITSSTFTSIARMLGSSGDIRVWWRGPDQWRVDRISSTGESDLVRDGGLAVTWDYEGNRVSFTPYSPIRLPDDSDLVPVSLADRMLSGATAAELSRLPSRRIAGHSAAGLRLVPADTRSTIARVDIWADDANGLPLRVDVYGRQDATHPVLTTQLVALTSKTPSRKDTNFELAPTVDFSRGVAADDAAGANAFAPFVPPDTLAGLPRLGNPNDFGAVGVYGRGPTAILAIPLRGFVADGLRDQLHKSAQAVDDGQDVALAVGPISVRLVEAAGGHFLVAGTVTPATLATAAADLDAHVQRTER